MRKLLLATTNRHKARELQDMLEGVPVEVVTLAEFPELPPVAEDAATFEANARKKAVAGAQGTGLWCLADDSGLEVDALGGEPGVRSARYAGPEQDPEKNNRKLLEALKEVPEPRRGAAFRCVLVLASPRGELLVEEGEARGLITRAWRGSEGFGYDPVFHHPPSGKTFAELRPEEKAAVSHRAEAFRRMLPHLRRLAREEAGPRPCPRCGLPMQEWHCRIWCDGCGYQEDCSDVALP